MWTMNKHFEAGQKRYASVFFLKVIPALLVINYHTLITLDRHPFIPFLRVNSPVLLRPDDNEKKILCQVYLQLSHTA